MKRKHLKMPGTADVSKAYGLNEPVVNKLCDIDLSGTYAYAHYLKWKIEERLELIKGKIFEMSGPTVNHQRLLGFVHAEVYFYLKQHPCEVFAAPFDVRFPDRSATDERIYNVLQPDICVVCDRAKLDRRGCVGPPDIVVEILSPGDNEKLLENKFAIYEAYGVREYWVVDSKKRSLLKYVLNEEGIFLPGLVYEGGAEFVSDILPGFRLNVKEVFGMMKQEE